MSSYGLETWGPEKVDTYELGAKTGFQSFVSGIFNVAAFYNDYDHLRSLELGPSRTQPLLPEPFVPLHVGNALYGETYGAEAAATCEIARWWRLQPGSPSSCAWAQLRL